VDWAQERHLFGATLADQQWVQFKLAEMKTELECLRALTHQACAQYVQGKDVLELASMAKLKAGRLNRLIPDGCLQFWGGMGFTLENKVSRMYRDGRLGSIGGGADEVMLGIIAKTMGVAKRPPRG
jgi:citronellyl-CoA dehydrogenase